MKLLPWLVAISIVFAVLEIVDGEQKIIYVDISNSSSVNNSSCWEGGENTPCSNLTLGLRGLRKYLNNTQLIIKHGPYTLEDSDKENFRNLKNISILGDNVSVSCDSNDNEAGLGFEYSENITIQGITFDGCKKSQTTSSTNGQNDELMKTNVSLYFLYCKNVTLDSVVVKNIASGIGVVMYNLVEYVTIQSCHIDNCGKGGLYFEYTYIDPVGGVNEGSDVDETFTRFGKIFINASKFVNNNASLPSNLLNNDTFILPHKKYHSAFGRGGGISVFFKGNSSNNTFLIHNCTFANNAALWGGGVFAEFQDRARSNNFTVSSSKIRRNSVSYDESNNSGTGGGGARVGFIYFDDFYAYNNSILFDDCDFCSNRGYFGGGLSLYSAREPIHSLGYNQFTMRRSQFKNNQARIGSGADLSTWHASNIGAVLVPNIESCEFMNNGYSQTSNTSSGLIGIGALYVDTLHANFSGNNSFVGNNGTALAVTGGYITIYDNCDVTFTNNTGRNGGAIALLGNAYIITSENTSLTFTGNKAMYHGGAIYFYSSGERDLISSRNCFIRYKDINVSPDEWNASFTFRDNELFSGQRNAIHTPSVLSCLWGGAYGEVNTGPENVFCWGNNWDYGNENCTQLISSDAFKFDSTDTVLKDYQIPGKVPINLTDVLQVENELHNKNVTHSTIYIASIFSEIDEGCCRLGKRKGESFVYITHDELYLYAKPNVTVKVQLETLDPVVIRKTIDIHFTNCPPGFSTHKDNYSCSCDDVYKPYVLCNSANYSLSLLKGAWFGKCPKQNNATDHAETYCVGASPYMKLVDESNAYINLSSSTNDVICSKINRTGVLCADCQQGYCVDVNSADYKCVNVNDTVRYGLLLYIVTTYVPVTIFFTLIFIFSSSVTSGPLNSYIFFAQIITTSVKIEADGMIPLSAWMQSYAKFFKYASHIPYEIWNLNFKNVIPVAVCLNRNNGTSTNNSLSQGGLFFLSLDYIAAIYPLILLFLLIVCITLYNKGIAVRIFRPIHNCCSRMRLYTGITQSIAGGVAIFIIISYTKFTLISNLLVSSSPLFSRNSNTHNNEVFFYDGNKAWPSEGIVYIILASVVFSTFVAIPPLILIYPTLLDLLRKCCRNRIDLSKLYPGHKIQVFLNEFHGCYKDGSNGIDCRWFASLYFCLRIVMFTMYGQIENWNHQYLAQLILFIVMACLFFVLRPYHKNWINNLDGIIFLNLAIISTICLYNHQYAYDETKPPTIVLVLLLILVFLPLIYCILFYVKLFCIPAVLRIKNCCRQPQHKKLNIQNMGTHNDVEPNVLDESTGVEPFLDYVKDGRRLGASNTWTRQMPRLENTNTGLDSNATEITPLINTPPSARSNGSSSGVSSAKTTMNSKDSVPAAHDNYKLE